MRAGRIAVEPAQPGAGEQAEGEDILVAGATEAVRGVAQRSPAILAGLRSRQNSRIKRGSAEREMVEGDGQQ